MESLNPVIIITFNLLLYLQTNPFTMSNVLLMSDNQKNEAKRTTDPAKRIIIKRGTILKCYIRIAWL